MRFSYHIDTTITLLSVWGQRPFTSLHFLNQELRLRDYQPYRKCLTVLHCIQVLLYTVTILCFVSFIRSRTWWRTWWMTFDRPTLSGPCWHGADSARRDTRAWTSTTSPPAGGTVWPSMPSYTTSGDPSQSLLSLSLLWTTFIHVRKIFARFRRASIIISTNAKSCCHDMSLIYFFKTIYIMIVRISRCKLVYLLQIAK